jgi:hypothetical protein
MDTVVLSRIQRGLGRKEALTGEFTSQREYKTTMNNCQLLLCYARTADLGKNVKIDLCVDCVVEHPSILVSVFYYFSLLMINNSTYCHRP